MISRTLALVCIGLLLLAPAASAEDALPGGRAIVANASVSPSTHLFGDTVVARLDIVLDPAQFEPDRLRTRLQFEPYETVGRVVETRHEVGDLVHLRYETTLRCLHERCLAPRLETPLGRQEEGRGERHTIRLAPVEILYRETGGTTTLLLTRQFPALQVVSRINTAQSLDPNARPGPQGAFVASTEPPAPTYRIRPALLAGGALVAALLVALFPSILLWRFAQIRWRATRLKRPLSPLERALVLVDWTARRDDDEDRRKALEALADVLEHEGARPLAETTRALAWAEEPPLPERTAQAGSEGRRALSGGGDRHA